MIIVKKEEVYHVSDDKGSVTIEMSVDWHKKKVSIYPTHASFGAGFIFEYSDPLKASLVGILICQAAQFAKELFEGISISESFSSEEARFNLTGT